MSCSESILREERAMKLAIIVPTLDESAEIRAALERLQPLRALGHEVILADGGSTDGTPELAAPWVDRLIKAPRGRARQMNAGAAQVRADALLFLHVDTHLPEGAPVLIEGALRRRAWGRFDVRIQGRSSILPIVATLMNWRSRLSGIATGDQAIFCTSAAFSTVGGYPDQPLMEDIEFSKRLKGCGRPACLRARVATSGRRWEAYGPWRTIFLMWRLRFDYWRGVPAHRLARSYRRSDPVDQRFPDD